HRFADCEYSHRGGLVDRHGHQLSYAVLVMKKIHRLSRTVGALRLIGALALIPVTALLVVLSTAGLHPVPAFAARGNQLQTVTPNGPTSCLDIPVSSAVIDPTSCWVTGPTSIVVAGTDHRSARDGEVVVVEDQIKRATTLHGA